MVSIYEIKNCIWTSLCQSRVFYCKSVWLCSSILLNKSLENITALLNHLQRMLYLDGRVSVCAVVYVYIYVRVCYFNNNSVIIEYNSWRIFCSYHITRTPSCIKDYWKRQKKNMKNKKLTKPLCNVHTHICMYLSRCPYIFVHL